jgi:hypothetical protein
MGNPHDTVGDKLGKNTFLRSKKKEKREKSRETTRKKRCSTFCKGFKL